jgi:acylphosphatase
MPDNIARHLNIHGRVQGVWYRESMRREAEVYGISGWVRNRANGTVEAYVEGHPDAIEALVAWCHEGPPLAQVSRVEVCPVVADPLDAGSIDIGLIDIDPATLKPGAPRRSLGFLVLPSE